MSFQNESVVQTKTCPQCGVSFDITDKDLEFYKKISPNFSGTICPIPSPSLCPECQQQRRLTFRNERNLYKAQCDATGKNMISMYSPDKPHVIYDYKFWWSDSWDIMDYGLTVDLKRSFFAHFESLFKGVPLYALMIQNSENCDYTNLGIGNKGNYMTIGGDFSEDCMYATFLFHSTKSLDSYFSFHCDNSYEFLDCSKINKSYFVDNSINLYNCYFCKDCVGCNNCIGCVGLSNAQYHVFNTPVSPEEFASIQQKLSSHTELENLRKRFAEFLLTTPLKANYIKNSESVTGDNIAYSQSCTNCFDIDQTQEAKNVFLSSQLENALSCSHVGHKSAWFYDNMGVSGSHNILFSNYCFGENSNLLYCISCEQSSNCFGCIGLRNKQYCILNKQYTKEEYETLVPKIIEKMRDDGEWGEFFPSSLSPFGYNETVAQEYFPLTREEAIQQGFNWSDYEAPFPKVEKVIPASKLPDNITDIPDDILNWAIECEITKKPFRIIPQELEFYRKHSLPIPRRHPDQRHLDRMSLRNPRKLFERECDHPDCITIMQTTYSPDRPEKVYCENCYNKEIY